MSAAEHDPPFKGWTDDEIANWARAVQPIISRLCHLQERVAGTVFSYAHAADCFCADGGYWTSMQGHACRYFRHDGKTLDFIERVVDAAIDNPEIMVLIDAGASA